MTCLFIRYGLDGDQLWNGQKGRQRQQVPKHNRQADIHWNAKHWQVQFLFT